MKVFFKKLHEDAIIPSFGHGDQNNAGLDFYARLDKPVWIWPLCSAKIGTGIAWKPEEVKKPLVSDYKPALLVRGRSGVTTKGLSVSEGTVDAGYRGEIMLHARCFRLLPWIIKPGMRIAQGVVFLIPCVNVEETTDLDETIRGKKGFGSSGK